MNSKVTISKSLVVINTISGLLSKGVNLAVLIWLQQYLIKRISAEEYSLYPVFVSMLMFLLIAKTVFTGGIARYLIAARAKGDDKKISEIVSSTFVLNCFVALIFFLLSYPLIINIEHVIRVDDAYILDSRIMMFVMVISFCLRLMFSSFESGLMVEQHFIIINVINLSQNIVRLILLLIVLESFEPRIVYVVIVTESCQILGLVFLCYFSKRKLPFMKFELSSVKKDVLKDVLNFGLWSFLGMIANRIRIFADPLILNRLTNPYQVTIFYLGSLIPRQLDGTISRSLYSILPSITAMYETGQEERLVRTYIRVGRIMIWGFMFISVPLMVVSKEIFGLYTDNMYAESATVFLILITASGLQQAYSSVYRISYAMARIKQYTVISFVSQMLNLALTIYLILYYKLDAFGAAASTLIVRLLVEFPLLSLLGVKLLKIKYSYWFYNSFIKGIVPALFTYILLSIAKFYWPVSGWVGVVYLICAGCITYILFMFTMLDKEDKKDMIKLVDFIKNKFHSTKTLNKT